MTISAKINSQKSEKGDLMKKLGILCAGVVLMVSLAACAGKHDKGDFMRQHASDKQEVVDLQKKLAKDWTRGSKLVVSGEKRVKSGQQELDRGRQEITEGKKLMQDSERIFRENYPNHNLVQ
jgi:hypothetical protein